MMKIFAGSDHAGLELKNNMIMYLEKSGYQVEDLGTYTNESCDYPDYAHKVAKAVLNNPGSRGLLVCGSGIGISMAANRHPGIRAALCRFTLDADLSRRHNDANVLVLGGRLTGIQLAENIAEKFYATEFEGGRHCGRIAKIEI